MSRKITGKAYADMYGPTKGDRIRLADTELIIEIEDDFTVYGDECKFGGANQSGTAWANRHRLQGKMFWTW